MIQLTGVTVRFNTNDEEVIAVDSVDLTVTAGEVVLLRGRSGSGKSTLLSVIAGLERVTSGSIRVGDVGVDQASDKTLASLRLASLGIVFQENNLIPEFNAIENVELPLRARGLKRPESLQVGMRALEALDVQPLAKRRPAQLSGGQKQRVGIARAIAGGKGYLLADEPTGALDTATADQVFRTMRSLADSGLAVIVASHDSRAYQWADREVQMEDGRLIRAGNRLRVVSI